jgi:hypothetical protein
VQALRARLQSCLAYYQQQPVNAAEETPWGLMHAALAFGVDTDVQAGPRKLKALGYLCFNGSGQGQRLFHMAGSQLQADIAPGKQGHQGQFLAILAQSRVVPDYPLVIEGQRRTIHDLIAYEQRSCVPQAELTFSLIGLSHYLPPGAQWQNEHGTWDLPRLVKEELAQPVLGAACGGTHRLMGFSYAVRHREKHGLPVDGQFLRAQKYLQDYIAYTLTLQNADGSFSTAWFEGPGDASDLDRRLETSGHTLEWLAFTLPPERLQEPPVVRAVEYLTDLLLAHRTRQWPIGPQGHALHALALYDEKVFGRHPGEREFTISAEAMAAPPPAPHLDEDAMDDTDRGLPLPRRRFSRR